MEEPIFTSDWSFGDEIKLLGALARLGLGNWDEISNITGKGKFECESHYYTFYYKKENDYIPKINILNNTINVKNEKYKKELKKNKIEENKLLTKIGNDLGFIPFSSDNNQSNRSININRNNSKSDHPNAILLQNACNTLGYWPKRNEFDVEYKNDAEIELMEIEFKENDSQNINDMYDKILCNYNNILDKRQERKNFVMDKNLFDVKKQVMMEKKLSREDREIYQSVKQNIKYLSNEQFNDYFQGIILEKNIKSRLNQLLYYYNKGYKTYEQILKYIVELKQKSNKIKSKYNPKNHLEQLNISLRESTVKQVNKLNENSEEDKIKVIKNKNLPKSGTKDKILKFYK
jgi:transcriptional adapter 2-alpha